MKNSTFINSAIAVAALVIAAQLSACNNQSSKSAQPAANTIDNGSGRIAYVNIDTLEANYLYLKNKKDEMIARQQSMEMELQRSAQQLQSDYAAMQQKAQAGTLTQPEYEAAQKRLGQMQQSLGTRRDALSEQLIKEQADFNAELRKRLDDFLATYNKDKHFDYVLSYTQAGAILYANKTLDITADVIKGLNEMAPKSVDTSKTK